MVRAATLIGALLAFAGMATAPAVATEPQFEWLCKPGRAADPCVGQPGSLLTESVTPDGGRSLSTPPELTRLKAEVDCFYVYPTVSGQAGPNADLSEDPEIRGIAEQQAARFAPGCRMFAPIYRQYTVPAILGNKVNAETTNLAYAGVKAAWDEYLSSYNQGRGIVMLGHSQGTGHLKRLIGETFDKDPALRARLVSAVLIGGNVVVAKGQRTGGNFQQIPACSDGAETGCVIAYSGFLKNPPPPNASFGRLGGALAESGFDPSTHEVLCVNPAQLDGSGGKLDPLYSTKPFPGVYGPLLPDFSVVGAPWANFPDLYTASCERSGDLSWLDVRDVSNPSDTRPRIGEPLGRTWGTHLTEVNDAAGNLVRIVTRQESTYVDRVEAVRNEEARKKEEARRKAEAKRKAEARKKALKKKQALKRKKARKRAQAKKRRQAKKRAQAKKRQQAKKRAQAKANRR